MNVAIGWGVAREIVELAVTTNAAAFLAPALKRFAIDVTAMPAHSPGVRFDNGVYAPA
jgi:hypothetical protein